MASCRVVYDFGNELHVVRELSIAAMERNFRFVVDGEIEGISNGILPGNCPDEALLWLGLIDPRCEAICAAHAFNAQLAAIAPDDIQALDAHAQCISRYCDALPEEVRDLFRDHCIMPEV